MPLAIELAAARVTVMNPDELLTGLDDRFQLLSGGRRRSRQRTLEATLDWSYDLLDSEEQRVFRALGVFVDGFDIDAVAAVSGLERRHATGHIETLQAKSLVVRADKRKATRFRLLETVKAYAEDRLVDTGEAEAVRDCHLAHFHSLAMAEGRKVMGSLDVGLRLRHDCPNITTAFEWAVGRENWITAGELLSASQAAYCLDARLSELDAACIRLAAHLTELDPELHGSITFGRWYLGLLLSDIDSTIAAAHELTRSPLNDFRAIGWGCLAWLTAFGAPESVDGLLTLAENERNNVGPTDESHLDAHNLAGAMTLMVHQLVAMVTDDFARARHLAHEIVSTWRTFPVTDFVMSAGISEVLLGEPSAALATVVQLDEFDRPFMDGTEVRALAYLALGDTDTAITFIRRLAVRAATGLFARESSDAMLLLAALAHHHGDDDAARRFLLEAGGGRQPGTKASGRHLARLLGIADEYRTQPGDPTDAMGIVHSLHALRTELARCGWD